MSDNGIITKLGLTALVIVVGTPTLPLTKGFSSIAMIGMILAIWGFGDAAPN